MNKKAMELTINTIVVILIALFVLGIGLSLVRDTLFLGQKQLQSAVDGIHLDVAATSQSPIIISNPLSVNQNDRTLVTLNVYNKETAACFDYDSVLHGAWFAIYCPDLTWSYVQMPTVDIPIGEYRTLGGIFGLDSSVAAGKYSCIVRVYCSRRDQQIQNTQVIDPTQDIVQSLPIFVEVKG